MEEPHEHIRLVHRPRWPWCSVVHRLRVKALEDLQSNSPDDLQGDVETFIDVLQRLNDAPEDAAPADFEEDLTNIEAAVDNIQTFADSNCEGLPDDIFN
jgi:hypothetical protein